jgi:hypothetical protein
VPGFVLAFGLIAIILIVTSLASGLNELLRGPTPPIVLDVRSRSSYDADGAQIPHFVRVLPITSPSGPPTNPSAGWWSLTAPKATRQPAPVRRNT